MSTISASTTSTTAFKVTSDTTGTLVFQTGATPTTALTLGSDQSATFAGAQTFTGGATFSSGITVQGLTVGKGAGAVSTNTAVGASALAANTTGNYNTAFGYGAGATVTTGTNNLFVGRYAGNASTGNNNTFVGDAAAYQNTSGGANTAIGQQALNSNTTASNNTAVGYQALYTNSTGASNVAIGYQALYTDNSNTSVAVGTQAGYTATGTLNTFIGNGSGYSMTSGARNTILGCYSGNGGGLDIRTASNYIVLSDGDGNPRGYYNAGGGYWLFYGAGNSGCPFVYDGGALYPNTDNVVNLGYSTGLRWKTVYAGNGTIQTSDANLKQDIAALDDAEKRVATTIKSLVKKYRFKDAVVEKGDEARIHVGVIAQEVAAAFEAEGLDAKRYGMFCSDTWYEVDGQMKNSDGVFYTEQSEGAVKQTRLAIRYDELLAFVISVL